jgi:hypothetical protein
MEETTPLVQQQTSCKAYLTHIGVGALFGLGCAVWFMTTFSAICLHYDSCGYTVYGITPKNPEDEFKHKYMVQIIAGGSIAICTATGSLIGAGIAKWCPCKR